MVLKLIAALLLGGVLGLERELRGKPSGIKTNALVALAACCFLLITEAVQPQEIGRVITGIVQGVGFIGGGIIFKEGNNARGLTGAAEVWISAAIGIACAVSLWKLAFITLISAVLFVKTIRLVLPKSEKQ